MAIYKIGQRWISEMEPELGLGIVIEVNRHDIRIHFPVSEIVRQYARESAPIRRVVFRQGDQLTKSNGERFRVSGSEERKGLLYYHGPDGILCENELSDRLSFTTPEDRLLRGQSDSNILFNLRYQIYKNQYLFQRSAVQGFIGGRLELIPHQFYIAHEIAARYMPRALLADEVGLGKTIEACLIVYRLLLSGRISRVLILVPESLVHQWFVELLRRFNLHFRIPDAALYKSFVRTNPDSNPFLDDQLLLCHFDFLIQDDRLRQHVIDAEWDMVVVDEVHHVQEVDENYELLQQLAANAPGLLLLTATPEQLGRRSHFARLRLLDPARYHDYDSYLAEAKQYQQIARIIDKLLTQEQLSSVDRYLLATMLPVSADQLEQTAGKPEQQDMEAVNSVISELLDRYGTGRVMFRNTRNAIGDFPQRKVHLVKLDSTGTNPDNDRQHSDGVIAIDYSDHPRIVWLAELLRKQRKQKFLLICHSKEQVAAINEALQKKIKVDTALFHENLTLIQRDRNAAWFAEPNGARLLLCSEIGGEGRNFQFVQNLILFDLPDDPELLEQRIGRLDRIGQKSTIHIYVPYLGDSQQEVLARWYHDGLNGFEKSISGVQQIYEQFGARIQSFAAEDQSFDQRKLEQLIQETQIWHVDMLQELEKGRDRLLELNSFRPQLAAKLISTVDKMDRSYTLDKLMLRIFDHYGIIAEEFKPRSYHLLPGNLKIDGFPGFNDSGMYVTFDRTTAMVREDIEFLSWDHPMVSGATKLISGSEQGNCAVAVWKNSGEQAIVLEAIFVLECVAPPSLHINRFLPATPIRILVNHLQEDVSEEYPEKELAANLKGDASGKLLENPQLHDLIPDMIITCRERAEKRSAEIIEASLSIMEDRLHTELNRMRTLQAVNPNIKPDEIEHIARETDQLHNHISAAQLRLDALRLIWKME